MKNIIKVTFKHLSLLGIQYSGNLENLNYSLVDLIFAKRYRKLIIDLRYSLTEWKKSIFFISNVVSLRGKALYVDNILDLRGYTNILKYFYLLGHFFLNEKFSSGFLSNFRYVYIEFIKLFFLENNIDFVSDKILFGIKNIRRIPNVIFIPDTERNFWLTKSSVQIRLPSISINNPCFFVNGTFLSIPGSTDTSTSISYFVFIIISILLKGNFSEFKKFFFFLKKKNFLNNNKHKRAFKIYGRKLKYDYKKFK